LYNREKEKNRIKDSSTSNMATNDKYDRQLRLWGGVGQRNLVNSHVLLIQADGVGAETLKNLVLPGIGAFTILDDHRVSHDDLGNNFFVTADSVGRLRAEVFEYLDLHVARNKRFKCL
jgi:NEDD8-activating enzyme E1 regulatory subunit